MIASALDSRGDAHSGAVRMRIFRSVLPRNLFPRILEEIIYGHPDKPKLAP
jgi:hypothetical protein